VGLMNIWLGFVKVLSYKNLSWTFWKMVGVYFRPTSQYLYDFPYTKPEVVYMYFREYKYEVNVFENKTCSTTVCLYKINLNFKNRHHMEKFLPNILDNWSMLELNGTDGVTSLTLLEWHLHYLILPNQTNSFLWFF
jgi:hypothetical protein